MSGGVVGQESFLWEDIQPWVFSDYSGGVGRNEDKGGGAGKKVVDLLTPSTTCNTPHEQTEVDIGGGKKRTKKSFDGKGVDGGDGGDKVAVNEEGKGGGESDHEMHIWTERERRKKMRNMFSSLHALLPQLPSKADKSTIVDEAVSYIRSLQQTLQNLQKQKLERLQGITNINYDPLLSSPILNHPQKLAMDTREAFLADQGSSTNLAAAPGRGGGGGSSLFSISQSMEPAMFQSWTSPNVTLNVCGEDAHISICSAKKAGLFTTVSFLLEKHKIEVVSAQVSSDNCRSMYMFHTHVNTTLPQQFPEAFPVEEIYKQAAAEIMLWVSS